MQDKGGDEETFKVVGSAYETLEELYNQSARGGVHTYHSSQSIDLETALSIFCRVMAELSADDNDEWKTWT